MFGSIKKKKKKELTEKLNEYQMKEPSEDVMSSIIQVKTELDQRF